jgi:hypothetical protein
MYDLVVYAAKHRCRSSDGFRERLLKLLTLTAAPHGEGQLLEEITINLTIGRPSPTIWVSLVPHTGEASRRHRNSELALCLLVIAHAEDLGAETCLRSRPSPLPCEDQPQAVRRSLLE